MRTAGSDKRQEKGDETYQKLIRAAIDIIAAEGVSGITAGKLSRVTKTSKSNIFHHFKSVDDIPLAVLHYLMTSGIRSPITDKPESMAGYLEYLGLPLFHMTPSDSAIYRAFFSYYHKSLFEMPYQTILSDYLGSVQSDMAHMLRHYASASTTDDQIQSIIHLILTTLDGMGLHLLMGADPKPYKTAWKLQCDLITNRFTQNEGGLYENR